MADGAPSQQELIEAIEHAPSWVLDDNYASKTLRALAELGGPDGTSESVRHDSHGFRANVDQLLPLLRRAQHIERDEKVALEIALLARELVKDIPFNYPAGAISQTSRDELLALASRIETNELEMEIRRRRATLAELDEASRNLSDQYEELSEQIQSDRTEWVERLDRWRAELDPKAAELAGDHYTAIVRSRQVEVTKAARVWMATAILLFTTSLAVALALVFDLSSVANIDIPLRSDNSESALAPLKGIVLLGIITGAMAWTGTRYQHRAEDSAQLRDVADRIALAARLDAATYDKAQDPPLAYQMLERLTREPLTQRTAAAADKSQGVRSRVVDSASKLLENGSKQT